MSANRLDLRDAKAKLDVATLWRALALPGQPGKSCRCPLHEDRSASFSVLVGQRGGLRWKCHASCGQGGPVELLARVFDISERDACRRLLEMAGGDTATAAPPRPRAKLVPPTERQLVLPVAMRLGMQADLQAVADRRGLSLRGVALAGVRGLLWFSTSRGCPSWIVTDRTRINAQARKVDGGLWAHIGDKKAWTLPGSKAAWPIGTREEEAFPFVVVVEGAPDLLAAHHFIAQEGRENDVAAVAMLGLSNHIPGAALKLLAGKRVRLFPHADRAGQDATVRWIGQLERAGCTVDSGSSGRRFAWGVVTETKDLLPNQLRSISMVPAQHVETNLRFIVTSEWKKFEDLAASIQRELAPDAKVTQNVKVPGKRSRGKRQIDILVEQTVGQYEMRIAIDCKDYKRRLQVEDVEKVIMLFKDAGVQKGAIVAANGFTKMAKTRGVDAGLELYSLVDVGEHKWGSDVTAPVVAKDLSVERYSFLINFEGGIYDEPDIQHASIFHQDGSFIDFAHNLVVERWEDGTIPKKCGVHSDLPLSFVPTFLRDAAGLYEARFKLTVDVVESLFLGDVSFTRIRGFHDEVSDGTIIKSATTDYIDIRTIEKKWRRIQSMEQLAVEPLLVVLLATDLPRYSPG